MRVLHIVVAMKPVEGNYTSNAIGHGVVGININGSRVRTNEIRQKNSRQKAHDEFGTFMERAGRLRSTGSGANNPSGRFPANVILDGSEEVKEIFPETGKSSGGGMKRDGKNNAVYGKHCGHQKIKDVGHGDSGSASRFFKECK